MPYIDTKSRQRLKENNTKPITAGELNYLITCLIIDYIGDNLNYQRVNDVVGALEGAKLEFYRRIAAPYEDNKIVENGDVY